MLKSHGPQLIAEAQIFDKDGNLKRAVSANNNQEPAPYEIEATVRDKDNNVIKEEKYPFRSFVYNYIYMMDDYLRGTAVNSKLQTDGGTSSSRVFPMYMASLYDQYYGGITVGTSTNATTASDQDLQAPIENGVTSGKLDYSSTVIEEPVIDGYYYKMVIRRVFTNYSGSPVTIREIGLSGNGSSSFTSGTQYLLARDTTDYNGDDINITLANNQSVEIKYVIRFHTSSGFTDNYLKFEYLNYTASQYYRLTQTTGSDTSSPSSMSAAANWMYTAAVAGQDEYGILLGIGVGVPFHTGYNLIDSISHGTGVNELNYGVQEFSTPVIDGSDIYTILRRSFVNDSSAAISITEAALLAFNDYAGDNEVMYIHIPLSFTIQPTESVRVLFKILVTN